MTGGRANRRSGVLRAALLLAAALSLANPAPGFAGETVKKRETARKHEILKRRGAPKRSETATKRETVKPRESPQSRAFAKFVEELWPDAKDAGVSRETFEAAFRGVTFDPRIVAHTTAQEEFVRPVWEYLDSAVSARRIAAGRAKYEAEKPWLEKARRAFGVSEAVIMGIWGMESEFGAFEGGDSVIRSLASLAFVKYQGDYCRSELIAALTILEDGDVAPGAMLGSWAGAIGETQFMPSSFLRYAIDFDGKGRRDIWTDTADAIGSTANYLAKHGWKADAPWGFEVALPEAFRLTVADAGKGASFDEFARRGVRRADGKPMPSGGEARLLMPAGLKGPIFLVTDNFWTIKSYNNSTSYALGVALLGDAILGGQGVLAPWPRREKRLTEAGIEDLQTRLKDLGYDVGEIDGKAGERLSAAVRAYQDSIGEAPDGYATPELLKRIKAKP